MSSRIKTEKGIGASPAVADKEDLEGRLNQLVAEVRLLESYYQEITARQQLVSSALVDTRAALEAMNNLPKASKHDLLVPIGGGVMLPVNALEVDRLIVSVGAGVAIEKDIPSAKIFLQGRRGELEKGFSTLEQQRKEIGSRLELEQATLQQQLAKVQQQ